MIKKETKIFISETGITVIEDFKKLVYQFCNTHCGCDECSLFDERGTCLRIPIIKGINAIKRESYIEKE